MDGSYETPSETWRTERVMLDRETEAIRVDEDGEMLFYVEPERVPELIAVLQKSLMQ